MVDRRCGRLADVGMLAVTAAAASWIGLGSLHEFQNGDSVVPVLVSLQRWTPFFWAQDRFGMLVPLLALPVRHPLANLIAQAVVNAFACLLVSFVVLRYVLGPSPIWQAAAALQNAWVLLLTPRMVQFHWLVGQAQYGLSISLGVSALMIRWPPLAVAGMLAAHWVNVTVFLVLLPLVFIRYLIDQERPRFVRSVLLIGSGAIGGGGLMVASPYHVTTVAMLPPWQWPYGWWRLLERTYDHVVPQPLVLLWLLVPAGWALWRLLGQRRVYVATVAGSLVLAAAFWWLVAGTSSWVRANLYHPGYVLPAMLLVMTALAALAVAPFERAGRRLAAGAGAVLLAATGLTSGWPSVATVQRALDAHIGQRTPAILASGATVVAGDYWSLWPAVFHANLIAHQRGDPRRFFGKGYRDEATVSMRPQPHHVYVIE